MQQHIQLWLKSIGMTYYTGLASVLTLLCAIFIISLIVHLLLHKLALPMLLRSAENSHHQWPKLLLRGALFQRIVWLLQGVLFQIPLPWLLETQSWVFHVLQVFTEMWLLIYTLLIGFSLLNIIQYLALKNGISSPIALRGIFQSIKLLASVIIGILLISLLLGQSPDTLLTGLGAMTAVLMLVFRDPILGLVAGIQLSANDMLNLGDWLEMSKYGADGTVIDISLTTVKVQNWDNTIVTIPAYALTSDSFKNWRGMTESGARRMKRSLNIDLTSIHFLTGPEVTELGQSHLLTPYINEKFEEIDSWNKDQNFDNDYLLNQRKLTNIGTFRIWLENWLRNHPYIRQDLLLVVRQLPATENGLPIEIYAFTTITAWIDYERIQSDIFDYIYSALPMFGLRVHQTPTGNDIRSLGSYFQTEKLTPQSTKQNLPPLTMSTD